MENVFTPTAYFQSPECRRTQRLLSRIILIAMLVILAIALLPMLTGCNTKITEYQDITPANAQYFKADESGNLIGPVKRKIETNELGYGKTQASRTVTLGIQAEFTTDYTPAKVRAGYVTSEFANVCNTDAVTMTKKYDDIKAWFGTGAVNTDFKVGPRIKTDENSNAQK